MSRISKFQLIVFSFLILTLLLVNCSEHNNEVQSRENKSPSASDNMIVSLINHLIKLKDTDFFRSGIESSVRSVFSKPLTAGVYALSVIAGVVAMLAFYESPVSPMPVPPLPDPPVGRFPPEHPIWPPPQKEPVHMSDKKRVGIMNAYNIPNSYMPSTHNSPQIMFPQMNINQKYSEMDASANAGAYQQLLNMIENRNSKVNVKQNRISSNSVADTSPQVYSSFTVESDPKVVNDSMRLQTLYSESNPNDRHDSIEIINKLYNQNTLNSAFDKIREFNGMKKTLNSELIKEKEKLNYTLIASNDPNANRRLKTKVGET